MAHAQALSLDVEAVRVENVGASWTTIDFVNSYTTPIVACSYNLVSSTSPPAVVRMQNAGTSSVEIRIQQFENSSTVTPGDVHCLVVEEGAHTLPNGQEIEARQVLSDGTSGLAVGWGVATQEVVTATLTHTYSSLVMVGQVMTFNDVNASVYWANNCASRAASPTNSAACVGKHIGQINNTRANETLGYIAMEAGTGTVNDVSYAFGITSDSIAGVGNSPGYDFTLSGDFDTGIVTDAGEDGGHGGWAVLYGADPLPNNRISLAVDEEVVAGDTSRTHTNEQVFYAVFDNNQTETVAATKDIEVYTGAGTGYALPGNDVIYTVTVDSSGTAPLDPDTVFLVDTLPSETEFYNGDIDDGGPETSSVAFVANSSGLTFNPATDLGFSTAVAKPTSMASCGYSPVAGYDPAVRHICFNPKGRMSAGSLQSNTDFEVKFRARIG
jgi:uncharacterized repeat protein (TIGR01451 family)